MPHGRWSHRFRARYAGSGIGGAQAHPAVRSCPPSLSEKDPARARGGSDEGDVSASSASRPERTAGWKTWPYAGSFVFRVRLFCKRHGAATATTDHGRRSDRREHGSPARRRKILQSAPGGHGSDRRHFRAAAQLSVTDGKTPKIGSRSTKHDCYRLDDARGSMRQRSATYGSGTEGPSPAVIRSG